MLSDGDPELQACDDSVLVLLHLGSERLGGSALAQVYSQLGDQSPDVEDPPGAEDNA